MLAGRRNRQRHGSDPAGFDPAYRQLPVPKSPNFGGLTVSGIWGVGTEDQTDEKTGRVLSVGANYANGPIGVAYVYNQMQLGC